jgi:hypothetical protein
MDALPKARQPKQEPIPEWWFNCQCDLGKKCVRCKQRYIQIKYGIRDVNGNKLK